MTSFILSAIAVICIIKMAVGKMDPNSPFNQDLPDCSKEFNRISRSTTSKAMLCPFIGEEEGFLSEWLAYHQIHGFEHVIIYSSYTPNNLTEIQPWIDSGFASVKSDFKIESYSIRTDLLGDVASSLKQLKRALEIDCKREALSKGYDLYVSLNIDEYLVPMEKGKTAVDVLSEIQAPIVSIVNYNYQSTPHILEPVDLLTIEAFQSRMEEPGKLTYVDTVPNKLALRLNAPSFTDDTRRYVVECCTSHLCHDQDIFAGSSFCSSKHAAQSQLLGNSQVVDKLRVNRYSRSLEKFLLKDEEGNHRDSDEFFGHSLGWYKDPIALAHSCQVRHQLLAMTNEKHYLRPGTRWYRNPEFGKQITDPDKCGRTRRPNKPDFKVPEPNPYHFPH